MKIRGRADNECFGNLQHTIYRKKDQPHSPHRELFVSASGEPSDRIRIWYTCLEVLLAKRGLIRDRE